MNTAVWTAYFCWLYITSHKKFRNIALNCSFRKPLQLNSEEHGQTILSRNRRSSLNGAGIIDSLDRWLFAINIRNPQLLSVVQSSFDNCHSLFSPTTIFEIGVYSHLHFICTFYTLYIQPYTTYINLIYTYAFGVAFFNSRGWGLL